MRQELLLQFTGTTVYRSAHPEIAEWIAEWDRREAEFLKRVTEFEAEYPQSGKLFWRQGWSWGTAYGFKADPKGATPGDGWRKSGAYWVPDRRVKAGRALYERLEALNWKSGPLPGMPFATFSDETGPLMRHWHSFEHFADFWWVTWTCGAAAVEGEAPFDADIWERVPASAYHLAREASAPAVAA